MIPSHPLKFTTKPQMPPEGDFGPVRMLWRQGSIPTRVVSFI
jgi:hypothetical protein